MLDAVGGTLLRPLHGRGMLRVTGIAERRQLGDRAQPLELHLRVFARHDAVDLVLLRSRQVKLAEYAHHSRFARGSATAHIVVMPMHRRTGRGRIRRGAIRLQRSGKSNDRQRRKRSADHSCRSKHVEIRQWLGLQPPHVYSTRRAQ